MSLDGESGLTRCDVACFTADEPSGHGVDRLTGGGDQRVQGRAGAGLARLPADRAGGARGVAVRAQEGR
eukprot:1717501-Rhodomonas_salina.1